MAHLANEDMRHPECGDYLDATLPKDHAYRIHEHQCNRCNAIAEYKKREKFEDRPPGTFVTADRVMLADL